MNKIKITLLHKETKERAILQCYREDCPITLKREGEQFSHVTSVSELEQYEPESISGTRPYSTCMKLQERYEKTTASIKVVKA